MRKNGIFGTRPVLAVLFLAFLFFSGCDLLNNKPEIDVERAIDGVVAYANAPVIPVTVDERGMGTASPRN
jgi:ABC-type proline/glycine betaine transport system permease subunit